MKSKNTILGIALLFVLAGCGNKAKYSSSIKENTLELEEMLGAQQITYGAMMVEEEYKDFPFVVAIDGKVEVNGTSFMPNSNLTFTVLGAQSTPISELALNASSNEFVGEYQIIRKESETYEVLSSMDNVKNLTQLKDIHIHSIKNLANQNCNFIYLSKKNELTYPDGKCQVRVRYEQNQGIEDTFVLEIKVRVKSENELAISINPKQQEE